MAISLPVRYVLLFLLVLTVNFAEGARRTVEECAAILEGPTLQDIKILQGNETSPVAINCRITCLNNASENNVNLYNPAVTLVTDRDSEKLKIIHTSDTSSDLYDRIEYTKLSPCVQENDVSQHLYEIYPTVNTNRTVVRCAVQYRHTVCMGESVVVIRYVNSTTDNDPTKECNSSTIAIPTPTPDGCTTTDTSQTSTNYDTTTTSSNADTTTSPNTDTTTSPNAGPSEEQILGATLGTVIPIIVIAVVVLLVVVLAYKLYHRVHQVATQDVHVAANPSAN